MQPDPVSLGDNGFELLNLLSEITYFNCTKRRAGLPSDDAIPTGGQLIRIAHVKWSHQDGYFTKQLVWTSQSFSDREYDDVCSMPLFGPKNA